MGFSVKTTGSFKNLDAFFARLSKAEYPRILDKYGLMGVDALSNATPVDTSETARSWRYRVVKDKTGWNIEWYNTNEQDGVSVVILIQYGHATGTGGYVVGRDFINPAIRPIFDKIADELWRQVTK